MKISLRSNLTGWLLALTFLAGPVDILPGLTVFASSFDSDHAIAVQRVGDKVTVVVRHVHEYPAADTNATQSSVLFTESDHPGSHVFQFVRAGKALRSNSAVQSSRQEGQPVKPMLTTTLSAAIFALPTRLPAQVSRPPPFHTAGLRVVQTTVFLI